MNSTNNKKIQVSKKKIGNSKTNKSSPVKKPTSKSTSKSVTKTASKSVTKTASKSVTKTASKSVTKTASKSVTKTASKITSKSRYTRDDRVHIKRQIENLSSEEEYNAVFDILNDDPNNSYSCNDNGLFLDMAALADVTLTKISKYLLILNKNKKDQIQDVQADFISDISSEPITRTYKLSNYEKNIIKQRNLKKILNQDSEYQELKVNS